MAPHINEQHQHLQQNNTNNVASLMKRYKPVRKLASAIYGSIWLVSDTLSEKKCVIKKINKKFASSKLYEGKTKVSEDVYFERQVYEQLQQVQHHKNIVHLINEFETENSLYFIFEYCENGELFQILENAEKFNEDQARDYFIGIINGLKFLHDNGVAHRDISLENILIDSSNNVKLCDFGLACPKSKETNESVGKLFYMAPEVISRNVYDPTKADLWSLGICLFVMLFGCHPVNEARTSDERFVFLNNNGARKFMEYYELIDTTSEEVISLIEMLLCIDPDKRITLDNIFYHPWITQKLGSLQKIQIKSIVADPVNNKIKDDEEPAEDSSVDNQIKKMRKAFKSMIKIF